jgi:hypothetical protein
LNVNRQLFGTSDVYSTQTADKLVAAVPHYEIVGAQALAKSIHHSPEQRISCGMTLAIVYHLQFVDVEEQNRKRRLRLAPGAIYLTPDGGQTGAAPQSTGEVVDFRSRSQCLPVVNETAQSFESDLDFGVFE